ncbi:hypothetical protein N431DRAFT_466731 [Stipitochalara longipes BDJ]|nr:hypothetical protein N431DRAFT_466731 [Stipitochalara longipes BDJ]
MRVKQANPQATLLELSKKISTFIKVDLLTLKSNIGSSTHHPLTGLIDGMRIAEFGTGTCRVWLFDASRNLPSNVELHGYDLSENRFPAKYLWPENVALGILGSLTESPSNIASQYDVVHLRKWASNLQGIDT